MYQEIKDIKEIIGLVHHTYEWNNWQVLIELRHQLYMQITQFIDKYKVIMDDEDGIEFEVTKDNADQTMEIFNTLFDAKEILMALPEMSRQRFKLTE